MVHTYLRHIQEEMGIAWNLPELTGSTEHGVITRQTATPYIPINLPKTTKYKASRGY